MQNNAKNDWESTRIGQEELETKRDEADRKRRQRWDEERKKQIEAAKKLSEVKSPKNVSLYVKPEDNAVYYVVDGETGKIDL